MSEDWDIATCTRLVSKASSINKKRSFPINKLELATTNSCKSDFKFFVINLFDNDVASPMPSALVKVEVTVNRRSGYLIDLVDFREKMCGIRVWNIKVWQMWAQFDVFSDTSVR